MSDIFLSYASEDREHAERLAHALEAQDLTVWWDRIIQPGRSFDEAIDEAIVAAKCMVVLWSRVSVGKNWVLEEATDGRDRGILVPVLVDAIQPPRGFRRLQAADFSNWDGTDGSREFRNLLAAVERVLGHSRETPSVPDRAARTPPGHLPASETPPSPKRKATRRRWTRRTWVSASVVGILVVALGGQQAWQVLTRVDSPKVEYRRVFYEAFDEEAVGPSDMWLLGKRAETAWEGTIAGGVHRICNADNDATASFTNRLGYYDEEEAIEQGDSRVSVDVSIHPPFSQNSGAGLLLRSLANRPDYYAFVLNAGGLVSLYRRTSETLRILQSAEIDELVDGETVTLTAEGSGSRIELFVGDVQVFGFDDEDLLHGDPGLFAYSLGCFVFDEIAVFHPITP